MNRFFFALTIGVIVLFPLLVIVSDGAHPFTRMGRAKLEYKRRLYTRKAELIARGYHEYEAEYTAGAEIRMEAHATTQALRDAGVES